MLISVSDVKRLLVTAATATLFLSLPVASMARADQDESEGSYIVVMRSSDDLAGEEAVISRSGGRTEQRFSHAINALSVRVKHLAFAMTRMCCLLNLINRCTRWTLKARHLRGA